ncbi:MAG: NifU family protein [Candidatus Altiarchaeota archaeon]|nr:NifU family protein [Candidatus Altiarchaeota archaeon]
MEKKVRKTIEKIRPMLQMDGGDVELVDVKNGVVKVKLKGACHGCPMSQMTLQHGIEQTLKKEVDGVKRVESVE